MDAPVVVEVTDLTKRFSTHVIAVDGLSFTVRRGQVVGLLGPNGAGKTTTLRALLGLVRPTSGTMAIFGEPSDPALPCSRGSVRSSRALVSSPPVRQAQPRALLASGRERVVGGTSRAVAGDLRLGPAADRKVKTYSHGMRQRLGFAQALLGKPELLILDEPVNGLDPRQIVEVRESLLRIAASGTTILLSSHLLSEVEQTCSHVVVMHRGRLMQAGTVAEVTASVASAYLEVDDPDAAVTILAGLPGVNTVDPSPPGIVVQLSGAERSDLVAALVKGGVRVDTVTARRSLEDAFLELVGSTRYDRGRIRETDPPCAHLGGRGDLRRHPVSRRARLRVGRQHERRRRREPELRDPPVRHRHRDLRALVLVVLLIPIVFAIFTGEPVASEARWGSLRYLLIRPVTRARVLASKLGVSVVLAVVATVLIPIIGTIVGIGFFGLHPIHAFGIGIGSPILTLSVGDSLARLLLATAYTLFSMFSVSGSRPWSGGDRERPGRHGFGHRLYIVSAILDALPGLRRIHPILPVHYLEAWTHLFLPGGSLGA